MATLEERVQALEEKHNQLDGIVAALASVDEHRNRSVREVFGTIKRIVAGEPEPEIEVSEPVPDEGSVEPEEHEDEESEDGEPTPAQKRAATLAAKKTAGS